jgi:hypothetical protein
MMNSNDNSQGLEKITANAKILKQFEEIDDREREIAKRNVERDIAVLKKWGALEEPGKRKIYVIPKNYQEAARQLYVETNALSWGEYLWSWSPTSWDSKRKILEKKLLEREALRVLKSYLGNPDRFKGYEVEIARIVLKGYKENPSAFKSHEAAIGVLKLEKGNRR